ncbi:hypothetical protein [Afipia sp. GAS231]|uniref:hypothetical protein n=1 Tax=Afipia sp. GAS231 TaxID=1882747 RepID=UPI0012F7A57C|nr:hypothetical protein [Afipia sp. GAS231]
MHSSLHLVRDNSNGTGLDLGFRRFLSTTLSAVLLSLPMKLIPFFKKGKNQSSDARKISKQEQRRKIWQETFGEHAAMR